MDARKYLEQVQIISSRIDDLLLERSVWRDLAEKITSDSGGTVRSSGSKSKMADAVNKCVDAEADIDKLVGSLQAKIDEIRQTIYRLDSPFESSVLHKHYILGWSWQKIANFYDKEYTWATTVHGRAVKHIGEFLEGQA